LPWKICFGGYINGYFFDILGEEIMHRFLLVVTLFFSFCSAAFAGPKEDAFLVVEKWTRAFAESDVDGIVKLFSPDAIFLGTGSKTLVTKPEEVRKYFENALLNNRPRGAILGVHSIMLVSDTVVIVTGMDTVTGVKEGTVVSANGRVTFVIEKFENGWKIVHFHRSAMPS
jgi:uncharacterized protein (TIGR02246 family)